MRNYLIICLIAICSLLFSMALQAQPSNFPYKLDAPTNSFKLAAELKEISGLSMAADGYHLLAIQDEDGKVFQLTPDKGKIVSSWNFWKEGDYEGVELCGDHTFVVKSTGTIYQIDGLGTADQETTKYNSFLNSDNDVEGLACLPAAGKLLIACKASPGDALDGEEVKAIYAFDMVSQELLVEPMILLRRSEVQAYLGKCKRGPNHDKLCSIFANDKDDFDLKASSLAVHPISGNLYLTSSKGNLLIVVSTAGKVLAIHKLPKDLHRQPEGICFDAKGNLYIANEARKDDPPIIHRYNYDPNARLTRY